MFWGAGVWVRCVRVFGWGVLSSVWVLVLRVWVLGVYGVGTLCALVGRFGWELVWVWVGCLCLGGFLAMFGGVRGGGR